jgi:hypothetical protein
MVMVAAGQLEPQLAANTPANNQDEAKFTSAPLLYSTRYSGVSKPQGPVAAGWITYSILGRHIWYWAFSSSWTASDCQPNEP